MAIEGTESDRRLTFLTRMCKLSAAVLIVALATLLVGVLAVTHSNSKFPFNAGGGIIAGLAAFLMSLCPMCMLMQALQHQKYGKSSYECCCMALLFWGIITVLGVIFGLAVNGIGAVIACDHRSRETGCWVSKETQFSLAVVTIILTSILLILISTIFLICCCHCSLVCDIPDDTVHTGTLGLNDGLTYGYTGRVPSSRYVDSNAPSFGRLVEPGTLGINNGLTSGYTDRTPSSRYIDSNTPSFDRLALPSAPPLSLDARNLEYGCREDAVGTVYSGSSFNDHDQVEEGSRYTQTFRDLPPSYEEVMEGDPMETPL